MLTGDLKANRQFYFKHYEFTLLKENQPTTTSCTVIDLHVFALSAILTY